jgi:hypothetical protein
MLLFQNVDKPEFDQKILKRTDHPRITAQLQSRIDNRRAPHHFRAALGPPISSAAVSSHLREQYPAP